MDKLYSLLMEHGLDQKKVLECEDLVKGVDADGGAVSAADVSAADAVVSGSEPADVADSTDFGSDRIFVDSVSGDSAVHPASVSGDSTVHPASAVPASGDLSHVDSVKTDFLDVSGDKTAFSKTSGVSTTSTTSSAVSRAKNGVSTLSKRNDISSGVDSTSEVSSKIFTASTESSDFSTLNVSENSLNSNDPDCLMPHDNQLKKTFSSTSLSSFSSGHDISTKIINIISFIDQNLLKIDDILKPHLSLDSGNIELLRYYNFNKSLKSAESDLLDYYQLPLGWRDNKFIIFGYRFSLSHKTLFKSLFQIHNETMNIYTHFFGFLLVAYLAIHFISTDVFKKNSFTDNLIFYGFFLGALKCLAGSCVWHTYSCFAHFPTRANCACMDYTGITVLITTSVISCEYASLHSHPLILQIYVTFSVLCGIGGFLFNWSPYFDKPECRSVRIGFFIGLALLGVTTSLFVAYFDGIVASGKYFFPLFYKSLIWYLLGTVFYGGLLPERFRKDVITLDSDNKTYSLNEVLLGNINNDGNQEINEILSKTEFSDLDDDLILENLIKAHFKSPIKTKFANNFFSLWWVDYFMNSHNIWHLCVLGGIIGHYFAVLEMFDNIVR